MAERERISVSEAVRRLDSWPEEDPGAELPVRILYRVCPPPVQAAYDRMLARLDERPVERDRA